jgi:hypothetical protein
MYYMMYGGDLTRMASKNHDQYLFCKLRFWGDAFAPLSECWPLGGALGVTAPSMLHHACTCIIHHTKWDNHAPTTTINTADLPRRHQRVCQLIKLGPNATVLGEQSNPNDGSNTQIKYRKYRRAANQIKSNGAPAEKKRIKSKSNTGPENPNGTKWRRAESPAIWLNRFTPHKNRSSSAHC